MVDIEGLMIEIYILIAVISNIIADLLIWKEVKIMRISHQTIMIETQGLRITMDRAEIGFQEFTQTLGLALTDHAKLTAKALGSAIGYYQGKAEKAAKGEIDSIQSTLEALGPLAQLVNPTQSSGSKKSGGSKFHV